MNCFMKNIFYELMCPHARLQFCVDELFYEEQIWWIDVPTRQTWILWCTATHNRHCPPNTTRCHPSTKANCVLRITYFPAYSPAYSPLSRSPLLALRVSNTFSSLASTLPSHVCLSPHSPSASSHSHTCLSLHCQYPSPHSPLPCSSPERQLVAP